MIHHTTFSSIMTYQQRTQTHNDDDTVEEASSLLTSVTASPAPARFRSVQEEEEGRQHR